MPEHAKAAQVTSVHCADSWLCDRAALLTPFPLNSNGSWKDISEGGELGWNPLELQTMMFSSAEML